jgi:hypothetical protein
MLGSRVTASPRVFLDRKSLGIQDLREDAARVTARHPCPQQTPNKGRVLLGVQDGRKRKGPGGPQNLDPGPGTVSGESVVGGLGAGKRP